MFSVVVGLLLLLVELVYFKIATIKNIIDKPNLRSSHHKITIRGGGIIFPIALFCWFLKEEEYPFFLAGLLFISVISFLDDVIELSNTVRIFFHFISIGLLLYSLFVNVQWYYYIILFVITVGMLNAYNFMDGINGITGLYSLSWLSTLYIINNVYLNFIQTSFIEIVIISVFIFLLFNYRKYAICFAGDIGSISIGFIGVFLSLKLAFKAETILPILLFAVYGIDSVATIIFRLIRKENIFKAHRSHLYQILANEYKIDHRLISLGYLAVQLFINFLVIYLFINKLMYNWMIVSIVLFAFSLLYLFIRLRLQTWKELTKPQIQPN